MLIIGNRSGQLCNQLLIFSNFIANAIEHQYTIYNPTFEYSGYFEGIQGNRLLSHLNIKLANPKIGSLSQFVCLLSTCRF